MRIQKAVWLKKKLDLNKTAGSLILWLEQAESADKAITKGIMWKCDIKATEIFRSGFRAMQCFNFQRYVHIARVCTMEAKCDQCADNHNTRECPGKKQPRCANCGRKHISWHSSCPARIAAKAKAIQNRTQDPGTYTTQKNRNDRQKNEW